MNLAATTRQPLQVGPCPTPPPRAPKRVLHLQVFSGKDAVSRLVSSTVGHGQFWPPGCG
jgi:hypothetical protein